MRRALPLLFACFIGAFNAKAQSCIPTTINGTVLTLSCGQTCTSFTYQVPHLKSTNDYVVNTIPINTYPNTTGTTINSIYIDDKYSPLIPMAFPFCFYGQTYNNMVVGSNSIVTFEALCASASNAYTLTVGGNPQPIPYAGGAGPSGIGTTYYPRTAIMAAYQDVDPSVSPIPPMRIEYQVFGTAPCRKLVISYKDVVMFQCNSLIHTSQIVLYESTGMIDIFLEHKPICSTWPGGAGSPSAGLAILGIQDETRTLARAAPGKNCTQWSEDGTGYRFTPSGGTSKFVSAQMYTMGGTLVATADTATTVPGLLDITFPNVCPPAGPSIQYVIKTTFNSCTGVPLISSDTITVDRVTTLSANVTTTPTTCGMSIGSITVTPTAGTGPYTYTLNGGAPVSAPGAYTFSNLAAGTYTIVATDVTGCTNTFTAIVTTTTSITGTATTTPTSCPLSGDGTITVTPTSGTAPYQYSLDGGPNQGSNIFTNVTPGTHTVVFTDAMGCTGSVTVTVTAGSTPLTANVSTTPTSCPVVSDGTITVTPTSGTAPYQYSLDGGPNQPGNVFTNVAAGAHTVKVTDVFGCIGTFPAVVATGAGLTSTINATNPPCANLNNGSILITPTSGTAPYQYSLNGGPMQPGNLFTGLAPGPYTINFTDAIGCTGTNSVTLTTNPAITATSTMVMPSCNGNANGSITLNAAGGVAPYQYSINGGATYQASPVFNNLAAGTYNFLVKDAAGCIYGFSFTLNQPTVLTAFATVTGPATCANNDGSLDITAGGGTPVYQYSIDNGTSYQASNIFTGLPIGFYNIRVKDQNGCITNTSATIALNDTMRLELGPDSTICFGSSITLLPQTNPQTDTFKWTPATWLNYDTAKNPVSTPLDTIKYYLTAKWGVCSRTDSIRINVLHKPVAHAGNDTTICYKTNATLVGWATNTSGSVNYSWTPPDSLNTPNAAVTIARMDTTRQFTLTVTDNYGCNFSVSDSMWVIMQPMVPAFAGNDTIAMLNKPHQLLGSGGLNYLWSPAGPLDNPFIQNPKAVLTNDTYFNLLVTDAIGCTAEDGVFVRVIIGPEYHVPNAFTPNGDGLNDVFRPIPSGMRSTAYFRVFNRFGQLVFETNKWLAGWDGTFKGKKAETGTYVWTIKGFDVNGREVEMSGTVILLR